MTGTRISGVDMLECCNKKITQGELWILKDIKGFTKRKLLLGKCPICGDDVCLEVQTNTKSNKTFSNLYTGIEAVKTIYRAKKLKLAMIPTIKYDALQNWVYGKNSQIKNRQGKVTQIRQYASNYQTDEQTLIKTIYVQ